MMFLLKNNKKNVNIHTNWKFPNQSLKTINTIKTDALNL